MIGRGLRLYPGKKDCHIIDMVATLDTGVISTPTLFGLHPDEVLKDATAADLKEKKAGANQEDWEPEEPSSFPEKDGDVSDEIKLTFTKYDTIYDLIHDMKYEKNIRSFSHHAWVRVGDHKYLLSGGSGWLTVEQNTQSDKSSAAYTVHHVMVFKSAGEKKQYTRPRLIASAEDLESAVRAADTFAASHFDEHYIAIRQPWRNYAASRSQIQFLNAAKIRQGGIRHGDLTRGQAADLITKLRFGCKKRFAARRKQRAKHDEKIRDINELQRRSEVRVGPVEP
jgi:ATP-dependent helicase IRC3